MTHTMRCATAKDIEAIVGVFLACWRGPYAHVLPASAVQQMTDERALRLWSEAFADRVEPDEIMVASGGEESAACGVVRYGLAGDGDRGPSGRSTSTHPPRAPVWAPGSSGLRRRL